MHGTPNGFNELSKGPLLLVYEVWHIRTFCVNFVVNVIVGVRAGSRHKWNLAFIFKL
jgi:hypothetical protein